MTPGAWILLAAVLLALAVGIWRAYADGRFRGTHEVKGSRQARPPLGNVEPPLQDVEPPLGKVEPPLPDVVEPLIPADQLGERATLLQFSSAFCAPCRTTRRVLADVATIVPGVRHVELDAEHHLDLVRRVGVLRTPTTLVLDGAGREVTRASGAPRREQVLAALPAAPKRRPHGGSSSHEPGRGRE